MGKEALVVERKVLFKENYFEGFLPANKYDYLSVINKNYYYHERGDKLENDESLQQIIPYVVIINPISKKIFAYRRASNSSYTETRLRNKWSIGVGGHIEKVDDQNPVQNGMMRELIEEVSMEKYPSPEVVGYVNYDKTDVERVHFGVIALVKTVDEVKKGDDEMSHCEFLSIDEFESLLKDSSNEFDPWTIILWPVVKEYISK